MTSEKHDIRLTKRDVCGEAAISIHVTGAKATCQREYVMVIISHVWSV